MSVPTFCSWTQAIVTLPEVLRAADYQTFMAGKWHLGKAAENWPHARAFERSLALIGGASEHFTGYRSWQKQGPITLFVENGQKVGKLSSDFHSTDTFTAHALRFIDDADTTPTSVTSWTSMRHASTPLALSNLVRSAIRRCYRSKG